VSQVETNRDHLIATYRKKARHYDVTSRLYPVPGYPQGSQRRRTVEALGLRPGDTVVDVACGTGLNFSLLEEAIGPDGRLVGVDLTDAMLVQAEERIEANGWGNVSLVQADAAAFEFPDEIDAVLSTYALTQVPGSEEVVANGAAALAPGGRMALLDLKLPDRAPRWLAQLGPGSMEQWAARRPWQTIRAAMEDELDDLSWTELALGTAFLAAGSRRP
jgi:demethylmenaquinone methyltransferase/2-methoxy-6-polyprenyl-1,4-benzoquinol methylase